jgi:hypothetical protein
MSQMHTMNLIIAPKNLPNATDTPAFLVDATDLSNPRPFNAESGFIFFGADAAFDVPELSKQWLTEIVVASNDAGAATAVFDAITRRIETNDNPQLRLSLDFNCTECGKNTRIVRAGLDKLDERWSYVIVDAEDGPNRTVVAHEVWLSKGPSITPSMVDGLPLIGPHKGALIDGARIRQRIADAHPDRTNPTNQRKP